jgi:hypothetical protein
VALRVTFSKSGGCIGSTASATSKAASSTTERQGTWHQSSRDNTLKSQPASLATPSRLQRFDVERLQRSLATAKSAPAVAADSTEKPIHVAKVRVAGSNPVVRSKFAQFSAPRSPARFRESITLLLPRLLSLLLIRGGDVPGGAEQESGRSGTLAPARQQHRAARVRRSRPDHRKEALRDAHDPTGPVRSHAARGAAVGRWCGVPRGVSGTRMGPAVFSWLRRAAALVEAGRALVRGSRWG